MKKIKKIYLFCGFVVITIFVITLFFNQNKNGKIISDKKNDFNTYINKSYNFQISYPKNWDIYENFSDKYSIIKIYPLIYSLKKTNEISFDHDAIYIFPEGYYGNEPLVESIESNEFVKLNNLIDKEKKFLLLNNDYFAKKLTFTEYPEKWHFTGSIWLVSGISNMKNICLNGNNQKDLENCDISVGDKIVYSGKINKEYQKIHENIIKSFKFI